ncbi:hypothetical protein OS493_023213 [Desmophyllum pertusum]|uniref:Uncharacterized protein n=1 Tax=Desmophyllum pertusum TaxID=174260 RepID=A0A9W9YLZ3_9CNID|nr:hypothetical protein OS493_023213 [Desmophyllum pertusum]
MYTRGFIASVIVLSCIVFVLFVVIGVLIWRQRRTVPKNRTTSAGKAFTEDAGQPDSPRDQHVSEPGSYMELHPQGLRRNSHPRLITRHCRTKIKLPDITMWD